MDEIFSAPATVESKVKTRASQIFIQNPYNGVPVINFTSQQLLLLNEQPVASLPADPVTRRFDGVLAETFTVWDPVLKADVTISVAGIGEVLAKAFCDWYKADQAAKNPA